MVFLVSLLAFNPSSCQLAFPPPPELVKGVRISSLLFCGLHVDCHHVILSFVTISTTMACRNFTLTGPRCRFDKISGNKTLIEIKKKSMGKIMQLAALSNGKNDYFVMLQSCRCIKHYCFVLFCCFFFSLMWNSLFDTF